MAAWTHRCPFLDERLDLGPSDRGLGDSYLLRPNWTYCGRTVDVLSAHCLRTVDVLRTYCGRTVYVLWTYCGRTVYVTLTYCGSIVDVLFTYRQRTVHVLSTYCGRTVDGGSGGPLVRGGVLLLAVNTLAGNTLLRDLYCLSRLCTYCGRTVAVLCM